MIPRAGCNFAFASHVNVKNSFLGYQQAIAFCIFYSACLGLLTQNHIKISDNYHNDPIIFIASRKNIVTYSHRFFKMVKRDYLNQNSFGMAFGRAPFISNSVIERHFYVLTKKSFDCWGSDCIDSDTRYNSHYIVVFF